MVASPNSLTWSLEFTVLKNQLKSLYKIKKDIQAIRNKSVLEEAKPWYELKQYVH